MEDPRVVIPDHLPTHWQSHDVRSCACAVPKPRQLAERKGAARTVCARCGLPTRIAFHR
jgi:hypothetical protein